MELVLARREWMRQIAVRWQLLCPPRCAEASWAWPPSVVAYIRDEGWSTLARSFQSLRFLPGAGWQFDRRSQPLTLDHERYGESPFQNCGSVREKAKEFRTELLHRGRSSPHRQSAGPAGASMPSRSARVALVRPSFAQDTFVEILHRKAS